MAPFGMAPIDCDLHPALPGCMALLPYLDDHWREVITGRGLDDLDLALWPRGAPLTARPDWRPEKGLAGGTLEALRRQALEPFGSEIAICNSLFGAPALHNVDMAAALCRAANDWLAAEWLDREPRLRAGILVPVDSPELAVEEIERLAPDRRFVQVLMLGAGETLLGRRANWPIYAAAERHGLPIALQVSSGTRFSPTANGWPTYLIEDHVAFAQTFQSQLLSLIAEGAFTKFPRLKVVLLGAGIGWVPNFLWRGVKMWRALRKEIPWVDRSPAEIFREQVRLSIQPADAPEEPDDLAALLDMIGSEEVLLFATDWPHWRFDGTEALPRGLPERLLPRLLRGNALDTYPRLRPPEGASRPAPTARETVQ
ncbi:amidohydrolase family protein [Crenalkalicoccus roseus]|uniref:amidohydrolase family protein n=1 Tax=Crenalkalicoccus roseus TaxID=1485588 RepID=UPI0010801654|nr:amidohydrolase family protein [Crenalkalicoccus roseus]